jgi:dTDP-4-dehydrorhamnose reductase
MNHVISNKVKQKAHSRILITGASGLLGSTLAHFLEANGYNIYRHGNKTKSDFNCDLTNLTTTSELLENTYPDIVINLAALTDVDKCEREINLAYRLNVLTTENLVKGLKNHKSTILVQISTDQVYDSYGLSLEEDVHLTNTYALTKYSAELAVKSIPSIILRTNFFGSSRLSDRASFSDWVIRSLKDKKKIVAFTDIVFNPVSMATLCNAITQIIKKPVIGTFNIGSHDPMTKAEFIFKIARTFDLATSNIRPGRSSELTLDAHRPKDMSMDCALFESTFGITLPSLKNEIQSLKGTYHDK